MDENEILQMLIENPDSAYITPDRKTLYVLIPASNGMLRFDGDFSMMSDERVNQFIRSWLEH